MSTGTLIRQPRVDLGAYGFVARVLCWGSCGWRAWFVRLLIWIVASDLFIDESAWLQVESVPWCVSGCGERWSHDLCCGILLCWAVCLSMWLWAGMAPLLWLHVVAPSCLIQVPGVCWDPGGVCAIANLKSCFTHRWRRRGNWFEILFHKLAILFRYLDISSHLGEKDNGAFGTEAVFYNKMALICEASPWW